MSRAIIHTGSDATAGTTGSSCVVPASTTPPPPPPPPITIRASIFFDGTGNNRANTARRVAHPTLYHLSHAPLLGDSFDNDNSNIEKLERYLGTDGSVTHHFKIYVEGIGTNNHASDDPEGLALGTGPAGVKMRVNLGLFNIISRIRGYVTNPASPVTIYLDAFGFSRGAAAARYFCYQAMEHENFFNSPDGQNLQTELSSGGLNISSIQIKFVGLFDTVASYGFNHEDDTNDLHLTAITHAQQVVHLASADEHRENFPLTNIHSKGSSEIFLPGVHSDIGGGYTDNSSEEDLILYELDNLLFASVSEVARYHAILTLEKNRLIASRWYMASEITQNWNNIVVNKTGIRNHYSILPLRIMAGFAGEKTLTFGNLNSRCPIPPMLSSFYGRMQQYCAQKRGGGSSANDWSGNDDVDLWLLRHEYFHSSSYYDSLHSMHPQFYSPSHLWDDSMANRITARRKRREFAG